MQTDTLHKPLKRQLVSPVPKSVHSAWWVSRRMIPLLVFGLLLLAWQMVVLLKLYPAFIIPAPLAVLEKFTKVLLDGSLWLHATTTLMAVLAGLGVGLLGAVALGYGIAKSSALESVLSPLIVAFQSTPVVAYAPLLIIWFGS